MTIQVAEFNGKISADKAKGIAEDVPFRYEKIILPWSKGKKDADGKEHEGNVPTLSDILEWAQEQGFTTEFVVKEGQDSPDGPSIAGFLVEGINGYLNRNSRARAENTPESARNKAIKVYAKTLGITLSEAEEALFGEE